MKFSLICIVTVFLVFPWHAVVAHDSLIYADVDDIAARGFDEDVIEARNPVDIYRRILQDTHFQARERADNIERAPEHFEHVRSRGLFSKSPGDIVGPHQCLAGAIYVNDLNKHEMSMVKDCRSMKSQCVVVDATPVCQKMY